MERVNELGPKNEQFICRKLTAGKLFVHLRTPLCPLFKAAHRRHSLQRLLLSTDTISLRIRYRLGPLQYPPRDPFTATINFATVGVIAFQPGQISGLQTTVSTTKRH